AMNANILPHHSRFLSTGDVARLAGTCTKTIRRWDKSGRLKPSHRTAGNHRRYSLHVVLVFLRGVDKDAGEEPVLAARLGSAVYSRVSSSRQKQSGELARQEELIKEHCKDQGYRVSGVYSDVGSGLNDNRKGLLKLLRDVTRGKHEL
ncbi:MerR family DNA-binding transcriptional regulator, partial [Candidatus Bathyarchaeota archaeon]|nr:MerR family DNA-binding transcriptional regulator [Candidatus Bathyarchaeota archaeon]